MSALRGKADIGACPEKTHYRPHFQLAGLTRYDPFPGLEGQ